MKTSTVRFSDELYSKIEHEVERQKSSVSAVVQGIVEQHFNSNGRQHGHVDDLIYESAKTRYVVIHLLEMADLMVTKDVLDAAAASARVYVEGLKEKR